MVSTIIMNNLQLAKDPSLTPIQFKSLLDLEDEYIYQALDLNEEASNRYIAYLETLPEPQYFLEEELDYEESLARAESGDHKAQFDLADRAHKTENLTEARRWYLRSAEQGNIVAAFNFGLLTENDDERLYWFKKAAIRGFPPAQRELGRVKYFAGDLVLAKLWMGCACRRGYIPAFNDLGIIHWDLGESELAFEYWRIAADNGIEEAQTNLTQLQNENTLFSDDDLDFVESEASNLQEQNQMSRHSNTKIPVQPSSSVPSFKFGR